MEAVKLSDDDIHHVEEVIVDSCLGDVNEATAATAAAKAKRQ